MAKNNTTATRVLIFLAMGIQALNTYLASVPEVPRVVLIGFGGASVLAIIAREFLKPNVDIPTKEAKP